MAASNDNQKPFSVWGFADFHRQTEEYFNLPPDEHSEHLGIGGPGEVVTAEES